MKRNVQTIFYIQQIVEINFFIQLTLVLFFEWFFNGEREVECGYDE